MAFPGNSNNYPSEITQLSSSDPVAADGSTPGDGLGKANAQARELADRTAWLKDAIARIGAVDNITETNNNLLTVLGVSTVQQAWELLHQRINATSIPNFQGLGLGDYLDLTMGLPAPADIAWNENHLNLRMYIVGFNTYKGSQGDTLPPTFRSLG